MRELTKSEMEQVSGGLIDELFGITQIGRGLTAFSVAGALAGSFTAGYAVGTWAYKGYIGPRFVTP
jgi:bacteriocin-like protein